ncbi:efflux RND transporter periplasmic adaptor subunit [Thiorhodococcus minor]|uniref:Efflux RND transporter periplasmic adaptor subunit n=2 Tax=Thiorhodococcus minor TaxID=57489 RepID=A0A6M0JVS8_9GAMM|nr:efflux RND transporter periplasmic adaptor subunit [Thiorhodococcus minor]NEV60713.1 efflux RND transporter periplasmic adaptor subunit [Thiorhodococcus minor]
MISRFLLVLIALLAIVGGLAFIKYTQIQKEMAGASRPRPAPVVSVTHVTSETWQPSLKAVGTVQAVQGTLVNNQVPGQVQEILFESGAMVTKGQILIRLDDEVDRADLDGLLAAERLAGIKLKRNRSLLKDRAVAQGDVDEITAALDQARAQVKAKRATIEKKAIRAPFSGQLGIRQVNLGQYLPAGSSIVSLQALDPTFVDYSLPERHLAVLTKGQEVQARVAAYPDRVFSGRIEAISPAIDQGTRNVQVRARFTNQDLALRPGMFARVTTLLPTRGETLTLPREAITFSTYGDSVYLVREVEGKPQVQRRQIRTGDARGGRVAVLEGLADGDTVVLAGQVKLTNGQEIRIKEEAPSTGSHQGPTPSASTP